VNLVNFGETRDAKLKPMNEADKQFLASEKEFKMLKKRKFQVFVLFAAIVIIAMSTISAISPPALVEADLSWPPRPVFWRLKDESVISPSNRPSLDECFDVSIGELSQCRAASETSTN
jgi:hypothetical protein